MQFSPSRCPPSTKSGVGVYEDRGSSWPQVNPVCPLTLPHTHYTHFSCLVGFLGCKHGWNRPNGRKLPMKRSLPDVFLTILMELDPPTILPCNVHIVRMIFTFYSVSFWPSWPEICCRKGSKQQFGDGTACYVGKKCQNGKNFFPPRTIISVAWWWAKKIYILFTLAKVMGVQSSTFQKMTQNWHILMQIWG